MVENVAIVGGSGALGQAFTKVLTKLYPNASIHTFSRVLPKTCLANVHEYLINYQDENSIEQAALIASKDLPLDMIIVTIGILHETDLMPEKSLKDLSAHKFRRLFEVNTILPALVAKHFLPQLNKENRAIFAAISARAGSISDNQMGGWYAYRASKAALNMILKNAAIEIGRRNKNAIIVGLHPGTVDSALSKPFQGFVSDGHLFTPEFAASQLIAVLEQLTPDQSGGFYSWEGEKIDP